jgi:hypothetical protein
LLHPHRFDQARLRAEPGQVVIAQRLSGDHDRGDPSDSRRIELFLAELETVHVGHEEVEQNQGDAGPELRQLLVSLPARTRHDRGEPLAADDIGEQLAQCGLIVDDQDHASLKKGQHFSRT